MKIVYTQEKDHGIGTLEIDGVRVEGLVSVNIMANTDNDLIHFPTITVAYYDDKGFKVIKNLISMDKSQPNLIL